jgi:hypothetical protein
MSKNTLPLAPDLHPDRRRSRIPQIASIFVLAPVLTPLIVELVSLCHGQWSEILGNPVTVRTPILNAMGERIASVREDLWCYVGSRFQRVPWNPKVVLPLIALVMIVAMKMLRL